VEGEEEQEEEDNDDNISAVAYPTFMKDYVLRFFLFLEWCNPHKAN
jgi:hypothetical protein